MSKSSFANALKEKYESFKTDCSKALKSNKSQKFSKKELAKIKQKMKQSSMGTRG